MTVRWSPILHWTLCSNRAISSLALQASIRKRIAQPEPGGPARPEAVSPATGGACRRRPRCCVFGCELQGKGERGKLGGVSTSTQYEGPPVGRRAQTSENEGLWTLSVITFKLRATRSGAMVLSIWLSDKTKRTDYWEYIWTSSVALLLISVPDAPSTTSASSPRRPRTPAGPPVSARRSSARRGRGRRGRHAPGGTPRTLEAPRADPA